MFCSYAHEHVRLGLLVGPLGLHDMHSRAYPLCMRDSYITDQFFVFHPTSKSPFSSYSSQFRRQNSNGACSHGPPSTESVIDVNAMHLTDIRIYDIAKQILMRERTLHFRMNGPRLWPVP